MKKIILKMVVLIFATASLSSCALYHSERQYDQGNLGFIATSPEVARIKQDKLALKKLEATPAQIAVIDTKGEMVKKIVKNINNKEEVFIGYKGIIANMSIYQRYEFKIVGPESKIWYLGPGQKFEDYLIPGQYLGYIYYGSYQQGRPIPIDVGPQEKIFLGEKYHWILGAEY